MSVELAAVVLRNERRIRLLFTNALAAGAFTSTSFYTITSQDSRTADPNVIAALAVPNTSNGCDLIVDTDIADGGLYQVAAVGVPALDASTSTTAGTTLFRPGEVVQLPNVELPATSLDDLLYGVDVIWENGDFVESADGDLATEGGTTNAVAGVTRRLVSEPLPYDPTYGARARDYADGPAPALPVLRAELVRQALLDGRAQSAKATVDLKTAVAGDATISVSIGLIGDQGEHPIPVPIPVPVN